ncbi:hypothetical protein A9Z42_0037820 [Trichoderma parareesei]|uniref:Uncharacterized protein n=1 Tax=Trichoderma parareesei TaxID=858221 RepID=A0A2H2ZEN8_TRIPA|nr:hypothetical protein A9Z42_0037820 [Trichoderma parareesei]
MDRARRAANSRRKPQGASSSPPSASASASASVSASDASRERHQSSASPIMAHATNTPQTAPQPQGRRANKGLQPAFTFSTPGPVRPSTLRKRSKTMDDYAVADDDFEPDSSPKKGGHSLRKRARVDYTLEQIDDDGDFAAAANPASASASASTSASASAAAAAAAPAAVASTSSSSAASRNGKQRRTESSNYDSEDLYGPSPKRRGVSVDADTPSSRRRSSARKLMEAKAYKDDVDDDEKDVQDTIEVGVTAFAGPDESPSDASSADLSLSLSLSAGPQKSTPVQQPASEQQQQQQQQHDSSSTTLAGLAEQHHDAHAPASASSVAAANSDPPSMAAVSAAAATGALKPHSHSPSHSPSPAPADAHPPSASVHAPHLTTAPASNPPEGPAQPQPKPQARDATFVPLSALDDTVQGEHSLAPEAEPSTYINNGINISKTSEEEAVPSSISLHPPSSPLPASQTAADDVYTPVPPAADKDARAEAAAPLEPSLQLPEKEIRQGRAVEPQDSETPAQPRPQSQSGPQLSPRPAASASACAQEQPYYPSTAAHLYTVSAPLAQQPHPHPQPQPQPQPEAESQPQTQGQTPQDQDRYQDQDQDQPHTPAPDMCTITQEQSPEQESKASSPVPAVAISVTVASSPASPTTSGFDSAIMEASQSTSADTKCADHLMPQPEGDAVTAQPLADDGVPDLEADSASRASQALSEQDALPRDSILTGKWSHLTPYIEGEYVWYPEKKAAQEDEAVANEYPAADDLEPVVEDNDDVADAPGTGQPSNALNTPLRGSPVLDSMDPTAYNSPAAAGEDGDEVDVSEEVPERSRSYRYRKIRSPEEFIELIKDYENMPTEELAQALHVVTNAMAHWQDEWNVLGQEVDDYENSLRRRAADAKYENRTRNLNQQGISWEEPEFVVKGYKAKDKEGMSETRYLQSQDKIMAAAYGFEYDPHPSKIGRQNPETQQAGIMTRGRSLRNQPKPTAKATEADEVTGKRQRKPVQLFDPATQDVSRAATPVPTSRPRRRKTANGDNDDGQANATPVFNGEPVASEEEATTGDTKRRRNRAARSKAAVVPSIVEQLVAAAPAIEEPAAQTPSKSGRKSRAKQPVKYDDEPVPFPSVEEEERQQEEEKPQQPRKRMLTLKIPKGKNFSEPSSAITDNGDSRPSTANSESSVHTAESSYSFRPKRQKRFRDEPEESEEAAAQPPPAKKRNKRNNAAPAAPAQAPTPTPVPTIEDELAATEPIIEADAALGVNGRKIQKIKVVRQTPASRKATPSASVPPAGEEAEEPQKDYKSMTKSEKMSASMKSRWANGNMAGAVEKRKATLAAKKAAQAAAEQRVGLIAPKPKVKAAKKEPVEQTEMPPAFAPQQPQPQPQIAGMDYTFPPS